jgi:hypothetical protein
VRVEVKRDNDTVWLTQRQMADLFDKSTDNVGLHLINILSDNELEEAATTEDFSVVHPEGERRVCRQVKHYNLDAIISVGYRVNSRRGVRFRQWATRTLSEHLVRGYTLNRQRFERNAAELEAALAPVRKAAAGEVLTRGEELGLSEDELAFYDALETNDSAVKVLGDENSRVTARELPKTVCANVPIDWTMRENVRAQLRVLVKRILRKYGYPPDTQEKATQTVLERAALLSAELVVA